MNAPVLVKPIPTQIINELAAYGPFNLRDFITADEGEELHFHAELKNGNPLPKGMICTSDGILTGIPAKNTQGNYEVVVTAENAAGSLQANFILTLKPSVATTVDVDYLDKLKAQVWQALEQRLPAPVFEELINRPITAIDMYYLLERWGSLKIWDAFNLEAPGKPVLLKLEGASEHYYVFDRGSCLVACPKDLFSHERTLEDGLQTARALAKEVYKRGWSIELVGFDKFTRAAWIELQHLGDHYGKPLNIINYNPTLEDIQLYNNQVAHMGIQGPE